MLRDVLHRIGREFKTARETPFAANVLAEFIRGAAADDLNGALGELAKGLTCKGSAGAGNWAEVPWLAVFDPLVTDSATRGYYVVYLFTADGTKVYLSMNQGTTAVRREFAKQAREVLRDRAVLIRRRLADWAKQFEVDELALGSSGTLPRDYEAGHAFGRVYDIAALPHEDSLRHDLQGLARAYLALTYRGGLDPSPEGAGAADDDDASSENSSASLSEVRRYRMHRRIERNAKAGATAKKIHGTICQACEFDFTTAYGVLGTGYIEAHHLKPLAQLQEGVPVTYDARADFAVLCANCHRMIHRTADPANLAAFKVHLAFVKR